MGSAKSKSWPKNLEKYIKLENFFYGGVQTKIQWTDFEIKFIKGQKL